MTILGHLDATIAGLLEREAQIHEAIESLRIVRASIVSEMAPAPIHVEVDARNAIITGTSDQMLQQHVASAVTQTIAAGVRRRPGPPPSPTRAAVNALVQESGSNGLSRSEIREAVMVQTGCTVVVANSAIDNSLTQRQIARGEDGRYRWQPFVLEQKTPLRDQNGLSIPVTRVQAPGNAKMLKRLKKDRSRNMKAEPATPPKYAEPEREQFESTWDGRGPIPDSRRDS